MLVLLTAEAYGRCVGLRLPPSAAPDVRPWLPHWWVDADVEPEQVWELTAADRAELVLTELELWVAEHAIDLIFVHAAVVALDGRALVLPGRSRSGKSSLTAELLRAGACYGSDEYAVVTTDGLVQPYPRPLSIRTGEHRTRVTAAELGADTFTEPIPIGGVAILRYVPGGSYDVTPITSASAVLRLFDNTICATTRAEPAIDALIAAVRDAQVVEGTRGEAADAVPALLSLLRGT